MNPEEFDSRLRAVFRDEYLVPGRQLWQRIHHEIIHAAKKLFWRWKIPFTFLALLGMIGPATPALGKVAENIGKNEPAGLPAINISTDSFIEGKDYIRDYRYNPVVKSGKFPAPAVAVKGEFAPPNEDSKWWLSFGIGPQLAFNRLSITNDSQAYIHKDLWANRKKVTHNGAGINTHASALYKIVNSGRRSVSFETGLFFSFRTEEIRLNETTYDIEHRAANNQIDTYARFPGYIPPVTTDTNWFDATQAFTSIATNKYRVLTVPLRFNYEQRVSANSFVSAGIGAGISMISSKSTTHYNLVDEKDQTMKSTYRFTASWNTSVAFYTNYNAIGQIGIYTAFNSYMGPWMVASKQYGIKMRDLQFGLLFRMPLSQ